MKQSWDTQKDLNEVTKSLKSLKSLILCLHAAGKQRKDIASHVGCSKASVSHVINGVALKGQAACGKQKKTTPQDDRQLCRIAKTNRFSSATQLSILQKWSCALGREVSTATTLGRLWGMGFSLPQTCNKTPAQPQAQVKAASVSKHAQKRTKTARLNYAQKSFLATNPSFASNLVIEELWFGEIKMSATIRLVWIGPWSSQLL